MLIDSAKCCVSNAADVAHLFCTYFTSVFSVYNTDCPPFSKHTNAFMPEVVFSVDSTKLHLLHAT